MIPNSIIDCGSNYTYTYMVLVHPRAKLYFGIFSHLECDYKDPKKFRHTVNRFLNKV